MKVWQEISLVLYVLVVVNGVIGFVLARKLERIARVADNIRNGNAVVVVNKERNGE